jgi:AraC-like DNA-binding protein
VDRAPSLEAFIEEPAGGWLALGSAVVWCADSTLCGAVAWGRPTEHEVRDILRVFAAYDTMAAEFDLVLDGRRITGIDPGPLGQLIEWLSAHRDGLAKRVRLQMGVIDDTLAGITLSGILPALGDTHRFKLVRKAEDAFVALRGEAGEPLAREVEAAVEAARGESEELRQLREHLKRHDGRVELHDAARELRVSTRTLQRSLQLQGTSFQDEVKQARFAAAEALIVGTDDKISAVAARVGVSEGVLTRIVREVTGLTPGELRKARRGTG